MRNFGKHIVGLRSQVSNLKFRNPFTFIVDVREPSKIKDQLKDLPCVEIKQMDVGDYHFVLDNNPVFVVERKSLGDFSSNVGKSAKNQKIRLLQMPGVTSQQIMYLIEDGYVDPRYFKGVSVLTGAIVNTIVRDEMGIIRTGSIDETVYVLLKMVKKIHEFEKLILDRRNASSGAQAGLSQVKPQNPIVADYAKTLQTNKKRNMTTELCFVQQMCQIYGMSPDKSEILRKRFGGMIGLCNFLQAHPKKEAIQVLADLKDTSKTAARRIGPALASRIHQFMAKSPCENGPEVSAEPPSKKIKK